MKRVTLLSVFLMCMIAGFSQQKPDFAYPKQVVKNAEAAYDKAMKQGNDIDALRAFMDMTIASTKVESATINENIKRLEGFIKKVKSPMAKALGNMLMATIYTEIFQSDSYTFNQRQIPLEPLADDFNEWSGDQFRTVINGYVKGALAYSDALKEAPVTDYSKIIDINRTSVVYYPTLYDFAAWKAISIYSVIKAPAESRFMPSALLALYPEVTKVTTQYISPTNREILSLYDSLLAFHSDDASRAAFINWELERLQNVYSSITIFDSEDSRSEKLSDLLMDLFNREGKSEYSGLVLTAIPVTDDNETWIYTHCIDNINKFPAFSNNGALENKITDLASKSVSVSYPAQSLPGRPMEIKVSSSNVNDIDINVYKIASDPASRITTVDESKLAQLKKTATVHVHLEGSVPFSNDTVVSVNLPTAGRYVVTADYPDKVVDKYRSVQSTLCTDLTLVNAQFGRTTLITVDAASGKPLPKATIETYESAYNGNRLVSTATTDGDGFLSYDAKNEGDYVIARKGDSFTPQIYVNPYYPSTDKTIYDVKLMTSLSIYRPGDVVDWVAVVAQNDDNGSRAAANHKIKVAMRDANYSLVDTLSVVTDPFGRAEGKFTLPKGLLTGDYQLECENNDTYSSVIFMVTDYKLPTFEIVTDNAVIDFPGKGDVTLRGRVITYSGFPIADATVAMTLGVGTGWWRSYSSSTQFYTAPETTTDAEGKFEIILPQSLMLQSPYPKGLYTATIDATSPAGESHEAKISFTTASKTSVVVGTLSVADLTKPVILPIKVLDKEQKPINADVTYILKPIQEGKNEIKGTINTADGKTTADNIPSGTYRIGAYVTAEPGDTVWASGNTVFYRPDDRISPAPNRLLWTPAKNFTTDSGTATVLLGTVNESTSVLMTVYGDRGGISRRWLTLKPGLHHIDVKLLSDTAATTVDFMTVSNLQSCDIEVKITPVKSIKDIYLEIESFRDKITPGDTECWKFRTKSYTGAPVKSAVILDMYDKALEVLAPHTASLWFHGPSNMIFSQYNTLSNASVSGWFRGKYRKPYQETCRISAPSFKTWGNALYMASRRGHPVYMMAKSAAMGYDEVAVEEMAMNVAMTDEVQADMGYASNRMEGAATVDVESIEEEADSADSGKANEGYRPSEIALALFRPMLTTDSSGNLTFSFVAPDANTTWMLNAVAFSSDMQISSLTRDVLSSKPVMVNPNLPRFLRTGDNAVIQAMVMNNTDSLQSITTRVELFDPSTGEIKASKAVESSLGGKEAATVEIETGTIGVTGMLGYRIKSTAGSFTDGEQGVIPVLSTITPVIETKTFYSQPDERVIEVDLPRANGDDDRFTLQFCENPLWTVVNALPGLREESPSTSTGAAESIYSALVASSIIKSNPDVNAALHRWSEDGDSTLISMLEKNNDLKTLLLQATPWVVDAMTDTERMQRLSLLFDKKEIDKTVNSALDVLAKSNCGDGGFKWAICSGTSTSSYWATLRVLSVLGELNVKNMLPDDKNLDRMIGNALKYIDEKTAADYRKYPRDDYSTYTYVRLLFPNHKQSTAAKQVSNATVQNIIGSWKKASSPLKAIYAMILERSGYHSTAMQLIKSLQEYAITSPKMGTTWKTGADNYGSIYSTSQILDAFATVDPANKYIDGIRQWLILQKEAMNWGSSVATTAAINAILSSSARWIKPVAQAEFSLNGTPFTPDAKAESFSGYLKASIPAAEASGARLTVTKASDTPAYGAVYCQYEARMDTVAPSSCDAVSVIKNMYVFNDGEWKHADKIAVGDRVKIELLIKSTRDMDYVAITDERAACLEPVEQTPRPVWSEGICFYRENLDAETRMFVDYLPRGTYRLEYELFANNSGRFTTGIATIQSQYAPQMTAHSAGSIINVAAK